MKKILFIITLGLIILSHNLQAETVAFAHTVSYHVNRDIDFNEKNYGVGIRHYINTEEEANKYITVGGYRNSEYNQTYYAGVGWEWPIGNDFQLGVVTGLITGYSLGDVLPYVVPIIKYKNISLVVAPYPEAVYHLTIDLVTF